MAKLEVNRSQELRNYLSENPKASAKETIQALASRGVRVNSGLFYAVKGKMHLRKRRQLRRKVAQTIQAPNGASLSPIEVIRRVKGLAAEVGGLKKLQQLVEVLGE